MELSQQGKDSDDGACRSSPSGEADDDAAHKKRTGADNDDDGDDEGTRQPYKCTFCRRGFPTAQALGGHMNVHRRHRGRPSPAVAAAAQATGTCYDYEPYSTAPVLGFGGGPAHPTAAATGTAALLLHAQRPPHELRLFGRDCLAAAPAATKQDGVVGDPRDRRRYYSKDDGHGDDHGGGEDPEELDLELRLGGAAGS